MTQAGDIALDGVDYMVIPGNYRRMTDGVREGQPQRITIKDFVGGQNRAIQLEEDRSWQAEGVLPTYQGQGLEPSPYFEAFADSVIGVPSNTTRIPSAIVGDRLYIAMGRFLYRSAGTTASVAWSASFVQIADFGAGIVATDMTALNGLLYVACGSTADIKQCTAASPSVVTTWTVGEKATYIETYSGRLIFTHPTTAEVRMNTGAGMDSRPLDSVARATALWNGAVAIATDLTLYTLKGRGSGGAWTEDPVPFYSGGHVIGTSDFVFMQSYGGKLYTWVGNQVMEYNPNSGASRQGWRPTGIEGIECWGATVTAGYLIVALRAHTQDHQVWAYDGSGWWMIETGVRRMWPSGLGGVSDLDLIAFRDNSTTYDLYRLRYRNSARTHYRSQGSYKTSLLHAGDPAAEKAWTAARASFATPEQRGNEGSLDTVNVYVRYSIDGGATWTQVDVDTWASTAGRTREVGGKIATPPASRFIQIEVEWSSVTDWAPVLTGLYVDYQLLESHSQRRRWELKIAAKDATVLRNGTVDPSTGRQIRAELWAKWAAQTTITLRDVDYDVDLIERKVRIVALDEKIDKPADESQWANSPISLTLVEV